MASCDNGGEISPKGRRCVNRSLLETTLGGQERVRVEVRSGPTRNGPCERHLGWGGEERD